MINTGCLGDNLTLRLHHHITTADHVAPNDKMAGTVSELVQALFLDSGREWKRGGHFYLCGMEAWKQTLIGLCTSKYVGLFSLMSRLSVHSTGSPALNIGELCTTLILKTVAKQSTKTEFHHLQTNCIFTSVVNLGPSLLVKPQSPFIVNCDTVTCYQ